MNNQLKEPVEEGNYWKGVRETHGWDMHIPDNNVCWQVKTFDDGYENMKKYTNMWFTYGKWKGKVAIINIEHPHIRIPSISLWKMIPVTRI